MTLHHQDSSTEFYFQPFSGLELSQDAPVMFMAFEGQKDLCIANKFPEIERVREQLDRVSSKGDETVTMVPIRKRRKIYDAGLIYIQYPWKRDRTSRTMDEDGINFRRQIMERVAFAVKELRKRKFSDMVIVLPSRFHPENIKNDQGRKRFYRFVRTIVESVVYGNASLEAFKSSPTPLIKNVTLTFFGEHDQTVTGFFRRAIASGEAVGNALAYTRRLIELPPNFAYPLGLVEGATGVTPKPKTTRSREWKRLAGRNFGFTSRVKASMIYGTAGLKKAGFGLIAAVGQGSAHEPLLLKLHYKPRTKRKKPVKRVVVTGKAVTFDTGGIDLKLTGSYEKMHFDMGGGGTALGLLKLAHDRNLPVEVICLVPMVENAIGPHATRPHDVVTAYDGKTVEMINTDAEGRLILGDSIAYAEKRLRPDCIFSTATLCDMSDIAPDLLKVLVTDGKLEAMARRAEARSAEKMILWPRLSHLNVVDDEYTGTTTDLVNDLSEGYHSATIIFMSNFLKYTDSKWVYVDVSSIFGNDAQDHAVGPGFGLRFLWQMLQQFV